MEFVIKNEHLIDGLLPEGFVWQYGVTEVLVESSSAIKSLKNIPDSVKWLDLKYCENLQSLDLLGANGLQVVNLGSSAIKSLKNIPASVRKINLKGCKSLESLDLLGANGLQEVDLGQSAIKSLTKIPASVRTIYFQNCKNLESLDLSGANGLQHVDLSFCNIKSLTKIPASVTNLYLSNCKNFESLDLSGANGLQYVLLSYSAIENLTNIPDSVTQLNLFKCENLESLDLLGANGLQDVNLASSGIQNLTNLPAYITNLNFQNCENLQSLNLSGLIGLQDVNLGSSGIQNLTNIPACVTNLNLFKCENLESLDLLGANGLQEFYLGDCAIKNLTNIPASVRKINLGGCKNLESLNLSGANGLQRLVLHDSAIRNLTNIPASVRYINLHGCKNLESLDLLGANGLQVVNLIGSAIENLTNIPDCVTDLDLTGCKNLSPTPELLARLDEIEQANPNARVIRPNHWPSKERWIDEAKRELSEAIAGCGIVPKPDAIKTLFDRFTSEGLFARSLASIKSAGEPVIDLIKKDRSNLKWMEEIASNYLGGCVNQPVQGWLEIAGYVAMHQEPILLGKVEASKQVLARSHIVEFVTRLDEDKKPGDAVEVEFGNALMRQVHQRLLENGVIKKPWLAIPAGVAHEDIIRSKLTDDLVDRAYGYIMAKVITKTPMQLTEAFLESQLRDGWCQAIIKGSRNISAKLLEYETKYQSAKSQIEGDLEFYGYAEDRNSGSDNISQEDHQKYEERYQDEFRDLKPAEKDEIVTSKLVELGERRTQIDTKKDQMLTDVVVEQLKSIRPLPKIRRPRPSVRGIAAEAVSRVGGGRRQI